RRQDSEHDRDGTRQNDNTADTIDSLVAEFADVFDDKEVTPMAGAPMHIHLREGVNVRPTRISTARLIPLHYREEAEKAIELFVRSGVIEKVTGNPTDWVAPAFFVPKPNGKVRLVVDYKGINNQIRRPIHPFPCPRDIIRGILPTSRYFIKLDAVQGYYQIPLDDDSKDLTTFLLPSGRYRFARAPMGLNSSSDEWCSRSDAAFAPVPNLIKIVDDALIQAPTEREALRLLRIALVCSREHNITLSRKKIEAGNDISFAGYKITDKGVKPDESKLSAIRDFPQPKDITTVRSFLGLVNQLGFFVPDLAHMTDMLRRLLKKNIAFQWLAEHQSAFEQIKALLVSDMIVKPFDTALRTEILTDASRLHGLGYALVQRNEDDSLRLIQCGSRSLLPAESRYATNELEALAIAWAITDCKFYLAGANFTVVTDHRPLVGTFAKPLGEIANARLLRIREKLVNFTFDIVWTPGKVHFIADALSRSPIFHPDAINDALSDDEGIADICAVHTYTVDNSYVYETADVQSLQNFNMEVMQSAAREDEAYSSTLRALREGKQLRDLPRDHPARAYRDQWEQMSICQDDILIVDFMRIIVPRSLRAKILQLIHQGHAGYVRTKALAQEYYFWPSMKRDIQKMIEQCEPCQRLRPSLPKEPLQLHKKATEPMESISMDLFHHEGREFLVTVDRFSGYPFVHKLRSTSTAAIINILAEILNVWGFPVEIMTDGGPQFRTEFNSYCLQHDIRHRKSSPYNPQSNGLAEAAVKNVKHLMMRTPSEDFPAALAIWRATPRSHQEDSPSKLFLGRKPRIAIPTLSATSSCQGEKLQEQTPSTEKSGKHQLQTGDRVRLQDPISRRWTETGIIQSACESGRSYFVKTENGSVRQRNRRFLKKIDHEASFEANPEAEERHEADKAECEKKHAPNTQLKRGRKMKTYADAAKRAISPPKRRSARLAGKKAD
ncbi:MAG: hypothetical protein COA94_08945, partial [Rickettsiales bacterium]